MKKSIKEALDNVKKNIEILKRGLELGKGVISGTPYIVQVRGITINPEIVDSKTTGKYDIGLPCKVKRFTKEDAEMIAKSVESGTGEKGVAVSWIDATESLLESLEETVRLIENK